MVNYNPKVSVIIPTYNRANLLRLALDSVCAQSEKDCEIIVIDDGSQDDTEKVVKSYGHIHYINISNGGVARARNIGIKSARGRFIAFLDSDDSWDPDKLRSQLEEFERYPESGMVFSNFRHIDHNGKILMDQFINIPSKGYSFVTRLHSIIEGSLPCATSTVMVRKSLLEKVGLFDEAYRIAEDFDMWIRIMLSGEARFINKVLTSYRLHDAHLSQSLRSEVWSPFVDVVIKHSKALLDKGLVPRKYICKFSLLTARALLLEGKRTLAFKYNISALSNSPLNSSVYKEIIKCLLGTRIIKWDLLKTDRNNKSSSILDKYY